VAERGGLPNADQPLGHFRFSSQILAFQSLPRTTDVAAVGPRGPVWELAGTSLGTASTRLIAPASSCHHQIQCEFDEEAMLDLANDIRSLSEFKRNTVDLLGRLRKTGHPLVLTINGKAELVVQDAAAYQALLDRVEAIEGIQEGLADVKAGRTKPARQVFDRLRRKHGIPR
jgi:PHD/YefM family antitoxin component YafN of YafNO toxin-antitoxin module